MMRHLVLFWVLLFDIRYAGVQAQSVIWKFPTPGAPLHANMIDTVLLDWTSDLPRTILRMWCQNGTDEDNFDLASSFFVHHTGPFKYVMETYEPHDKAFPLICHADLAADPEGSGFDSPAEILWSSDSAQAAKTISQTPATALVTRTMIVSLPLSSLNPPSLPPLTTGSPINSLSQSITPTLNTKQPPTPSTKSSESLSVATTASQLSTSASPNNTGTIVGGVIGGAAFLSFNILALLFLRKYQRDRASSSPIATEPSKRGSYLFNIDINRGAGADIMGVFEKEGNCAVYEKEGTRLPQGGQVQEQGKEGHYGAHEKEGIRVPRGGQVQEQDDIGTSPWGLVHELQGVQPNPIRG